MKVSMTKICSDKMAGNNDHIFTVEEAEKVLAFHQGLNGYEATPLRKMDAMAAYLDISGFYVKDESYRFGLNAFKGLGGSYALAKVLSEKTGKSLNEVSDIESDSFTFVTATDGNHGRGVAWAAKNLSQKAVVYMPKGSSLERLNNIKLLGAEAEITEFKYDDTVRFAKKQAEENGWILVQDTAWKGYEKIPAWIMQGYMSMAMETIEQMNTVKPTHIFLQAGVGAMAGALTGLFSSFYGDNMPILSIVEPNEADCLFQTAKYSDGKLHKVEGALDSIMAGLCCGEVCTIGWDVIKHHADYFFSCPDYIAADGMRILGNPIGNDKRIVSGESGAVTSGLLFHLMKDDSLENFRKEIGLTQNSVVLCMSTEGDTDKDHYKRIVWNGWYHSPIYNK